MWLLLNREELAKDSQNFKAFLVEVFFAIRSRTEELPQKVAKEALAYEKVQKIIERMELFDGFVLENLNLLELLRAKVDKENLLQTINYVSMKKKALLLDEKEQIRKKLDKELKEAEDDYNREKFSLQPHKEKGFLDYAAPKVKLRMIKEKIKKNDKIICLLSDIDKSTKESKRMSKEVLDFFHLQDI